jgi:hypothetical protein
LPDGKYSGSSAPRLGAPYHALIGSTDIRSSRRIPGNLPPPCTQVRRADQGSVNPLGPKVPPRIPFALLTERIVVDRMAKSWVPCSHSHEAVLRDSECTQSGSAAIEKRDPSDPDQVRVHIYILWQSISNLWDGERTARFDQSPWRRRRRCGARESTQEATQPHPIADCVFGGRELGCNAVMRGSLNRLHLHGSSPSQDMWHCPLRGSTPWADARTRFTALL